MGGASVRGWIALLEAVAAEHSDATRDEATDRARLPGFEDHEPLGARLNLGAALGAANDEVREEAEGA